MTELATVLRVWRERLSPADAGLPANGARRTSGLRREELAILAGVSVDYVVRLEQGRAANPSAQVCAAFARALQLSDAEQAHLFELAGHATTPDRVNRLVPASVRRLLTRLDDHPIAVFDATWALLVSNRMWTALMGDPSGWSGLDRNVVWRYFTGQHTRTEMTDDEQVAFETSMVADLRRTAGRYPTDPAVRELIDRLTETSAQFRARWAEHEVAAHQQATKRIRHPEVGVLSLDCDVLSHEAGDLRIIVYTAAPDTESATNLALLATIGTQTLTPHP